MTALVIPFDRSYRLRPPELRSTPGLGPVEQALLSLAQRHGFYSGLYVHFGHGYGGTVSAVRVLASSAVARRQFARPLEHSSIATRAVCSLKPFAWSSAEAAFTTPLDDICAGIAIPVQDHASGPAMVALVGVDADLAHQVVEECAADLAYAAGDIHLQALETKPVKARLSAREMECLRMAALGLTVTQTADLLDIRPRTVEFHLKNLCDKLGATNKTHAVAIAASEGLVAV